MSADASLEFPRMAYQSAIIALTMCDASRFIVARFEEAATRAPDSPKSNFA